MLKKFIFFFFIFIFIFEESKNVKKEIKKIDLYLLVYRYISIMDGDL
jgi:hypothetical protein